MAEKYRAAFSNIIVIYCSGNSANSERQVGDSLFLAKPCRMDQLLRASGSPHPGGQA